MHKIRLSSTLKLILRQRNLSLKGLAAQTGIPYSTLHTWMSDRQPKDILKVKKLADHLQVDMHYLLFGEEQRPSLTLALPKESDDLSGVYEVIVRKRK